MNRITEFYRAVALFLCQYKLYPNSRVSVECLGVGGGNGLMIDMNN